jgi:cytochrome b6-f complex iron-sulfur subunit
MFVAGCTTAKRDDVATASSTNGKLSPDSSGSFGGEVVVGAQVPVRSQIVAEAGALYVPAGRFWLVDSPDGDLVAIYQKCTHLGCRVPYCSSSHWFECPCHNSVFDGVGEYVSGPAPRSLDRFPVRTTNDVVVVDTSTFVEGKAASLGPSTAQPAGPHCVR